MARTSLLIAMTGLSIAILAACSPDMAKDPAPAEGDTATSNVVATETEAVEPDVEPQVAEADPLPTILGSTTDTHNARALLPFQLQKLAPKLDQRLRQDALFEFQQIKAMADEDAAQGSEYFRPYEYEIEWTLSAAADTLISVSGYAYSNTGGAHPNHAMAGIIHDIAAGEDVALLDLFKDREAALGVIVPAVREQIMREKMVRYGEVGDPTEDRIMETADSLPEHGRWLSNTALVGSTEDGKIGGFKVMFSPYDIGVYAEGSYEAIIDQDIFDEFLKPEYQPAFAGDAVLSKAAE